MNTHSREADARAELMAAGALRAGCSADLARDLLECLTTDEMLRRLKENGMLEAVMRVLGERTAFYLGERLKGRAALAAAVFSEEDGVLYTVGPAAEWLEETRLQNRVREH